MLDDAAEVDPEPDPQPEPEPEPERGSDAHAESETESTRAPEPAPAPEPEAEPTAVPEGVSSPATTAPTVTTPQAAPAPDRGSDAAAEEAAAAAAFIARAKADIDARAASRTAPTRIRPATKESTAVEIPDKSAVPRTTRSTRADMHLSSKRLDDLGDSSRESADLLTADRLLDPHRMSKPEPEGAWSHFLYTISGRRINIGDGRRARERKALSARIAAPLVGGARFVPVLSRKGGVGKTTITALLGMALADARDDRVIAVDANPDRGTLAERIVRPQHTRTVRDLVRIHEEVRGYHDISAIVARDATRLDVLASDTDPRIAEAFSDSDYRDVAGVAAHYYSLVLTDTGTGIVHSVMSATLDLADQIVIVSGLSVDEARLASETLTWLETNGYAEQAREAIVVLNQSTPGAPLVRLNELEAHFRTRTQHVVRMPYDAQIAGGGTIVFANLQPETRVAARELAALLVEGLRTKGA
nr:MinD/ParA family protein [Microbacterium sp. 3J1]